MGGKKLRDLLRQEEHVVMPGAYNAFVAKQIAEEGFRGVYISGAGLSNSLGVADEGTLGLKDFLYIGGWIAKSVDIPVICDADTGFRNIGETVRQYIEVGFSGLHIEDQVFPKRCGHLSGKEVTTRDEMVAKIKEACTARDRYDAEFVIIARTDARGAINVNNDAQLNESITRGQLYRDAGADMIFPESLRNRDEFAEYRSKVPGDLLANMTEFGKTPYLKVREFMKLGYKIILFPVSLFRYHAGQTRSFLAKLKEDGSQKELAPEMMHRSEINTILNYKP